MRLTMIRVMTLLHSRYFHRTSSLLMFSTISLHTVAAAQNGQNTCKTCRFRCHRETHDDMNHQAEVRSTRAGFLPYGRDRRLRIWRAHSRGRESLFRNLHHRNAGIGLAVPGMPMARWAWSMAIRKTSILFYAFNEKGQVVWIPSLQRKIER